MLELVTAGVSWFWDWEKGCCWNWRTGGGVLAVERAEAYGSEFSKGWRVLMVEMRAEFSWSGSDWGTFK